MKKFLNLQVKKLVSNLSPYAECKTPFTHFWIAWYLGISSCLFTGDAMDPLFVVILRKPQPYASK